MRKKSILNTNIPPCEKAYGRERVPAPMQVVSRIKIEETTVPLVAARQASLRFPSTPEGRSSSMPVGDSGPRDAEDISLLLSSIEIHRIGVWSICGMHVTPRDLIETVHVGVVT